MAYIGKEPIVGNFQVCDAISVVNGQAAYTMQVSSTNVVPESVNHMLVSLNGILQKPGSSFTISGSTITFASALATGDVIDFIMLLGNVLDIGTPSDSTVTNAKTNFVSTSSAAGLQIKGDNTTGGTLQLNCEQNSHGIKLRSPAHSAGQSYTLTFPTGNVTAGKVLKVDSVSGSGTTGIGQLSFGDAGGTNTPAFLAKQSGVQSISASTNTKLNFQTEVFDTDNKFDNSTNYRFTPATAGKYFIFGKYSLTNQEDGKLQRIYIYKNGSFLDLAAFVMLPGREEDGSVGVQIIDEANTTDYYELYANHTCGSSKNTITNSTFFGAYKIIE